MCRPCAERLHSRRQRPASLRRGSRYGRSQHGRLPGPGDGCVDGSGQLCGREVVSKVESKRTPVVAACGSASAISGAAMHESHGPGMRGVQRWLAWSRRRHERRAWVLLSAPSRSRTARRRGRVQRACKGRRARQPRPGVWPPPLGHTADSVLARAVNHSIAFAASTQPGARTRLTHVADMGGPGTRPLDSASHPIPAEGTEYRCRPPRHGIHRKGTLRSRASGPPIHTSEPCITVATRFLPGATLHQTLPARASPSKAAVSPLSSPRMLRWPPLTPSLPFHSSTQ